MKALLTLTFALLLFSCGQLEPKGNIEIKDIPLEKFSKIEAEGSFKVFYIQNSKTFLTVETYPNIRHNLKVKVTDGTLYLSEKRKPGPVDFYNITLYSPAEIKDVILAGNADVYLSSQFKTPVFSLKLKDNAKFIGSVISKKATIEMSGKSRANLLGETADLALKVQDSASIIAPYYYISNLSVELKNATYTEMNIENDMAGNIENTAKFTYFGQPYQKLRIAPTATVQHKKLP